MNLQVIKKILLSAALLPTVISMTTCKKISNYPISLNGVWYAPESGCGMMIEIKEDGSGSHNSAAADKGCDNGNESGKVKFTKHKLYIGHTGFEFLNEPRLSTANDSVLAPEVDNVGSLKKFRVLATMKLKDSYLNGKSENNYYKYIAY